MTFPHSYIAIRDLYVDPETGEPDGGPDAPEGWARSPQGRSGWTMIDHPPTGTVLAAYRVNAVGVRGLFALFGPQSVLEAIASSNADVMPARELWRRRAEVQARKAVRAWRTWIVDDAGETEVRRTLIAEGELLPATPPTVGSPWGTVTRLYRPAMAATLAGHGLHVTLEDQPDRGA